MKRSTTFAAIRPRPWPAITYEASYVEVVVGEELPPMKLQVPSGFEAGVASSIESHQVVSSRTEPHCAALQFGSLRRAWAA